MKRVIVKSVYDAFEFVMQHYYPAGLEEFAEKSDTYAIISIQDTQVRLYFFGKSVLQRCSHSVF